METILSDSVILTEQIFSAWVCDDEMITQELWTARLAVVFHHFSVIWDQAAAKHVDHVFAWCIHCVESSTKSNHELDVLPFISEFNDTNYPVPYWFLTTVWLVWVSHKYESTHFVLWFAQGKVLCVDDVITAGTAIRESKGIIDANSATLAGVLVCLDRQERGQSGTKSAIQEVEADFGCPVVSIICMADIITYLEGRPEKAESLAAMKTYRAEYGAAQWVSAH